MSPGARGEGAAAPNSAAARGGRKRRRHRSGQRLWRLANSAFGLWFLSTVVIGFGTWAFAWWRAEDEARRENNASIAKLDIEIATRIDQFANTVNGLSGFRAYSAALAALESPVGNPYAVSAYPELGERGLTSLIRELEDRVRDSEKPELDGAVRAAQRLAAIGAGNLERRLHAVSEDDAIPFEQFEEVTRLINSDIRLHRWPASVLR
jgi:hypothetical protein